MAYRYTVFIQICMLLMPLLYSCSTQQKINRSGGKALLKTNELKNAHVGLYIYEPATQKNLFRYHHDKYFVPASNIKIATTYAALKYLGDSLTSAYIFSANDTLLVTPNGDPTVLHPDYAFQPLVQTIKGAGMVGIVNTDTVTPFASGWAWNDFDASYQPERSIMPLYGNYLWLWPVPAVKTIAPLFDTTLSLNNQYINIMPKNLAGSIMPVKKAPNYLRHQYNNQFYTDSLNDIRLIPFVSSAAFTKAIWQDAFPETHFFIFNQKLPRGTPVYSQPVDSLLRPFMFRSDNFFGEQILLMLSKQKTDTMSSAKAIDILLKNEFAALPQKPRWVDGSGLSRYNLFSPADFVYILNKLQTEFGFERIRNIFATGGQGTIQNYYKNAGGYIYGKTGTLSGVVSFSGYMITRKGKFLIFSTLVNNHNGSSVNVRKSVEKFLLQIREKY